VWTSPKPHEQAEVVNNYLPWCYQCIAVPGSAVASDKEDAWQQLEGAVTLYSCPVVVIIVDIGTHLTTYLYGF